MGSPGRQGGGGRFFFLKSQEGGGSQEGGAGREGVCRELAGGGLNIFFGPEMPAQ